MTLKSCVNPWRWSSEQAMVLRSCGVAAIDVGGAGGSSMPALEAARAESQGNNHAMQIGQLYRDWGIATPISLVEACSARIPLIATGGVRNGLDIARALYQRDRDRCELPP